MVYKRVGTTDDASLPASYFTMAQVKKGEERQALQSLVDIQAGEDDAAMHLPPIITPEISRYHMSLWWHGADKRDLMGGINAFKFPFLTEEQRGELDTICAMAE